MCYADDCWWWILLLPLPFHGQPAAVIIARPTCTWTYRLLFLGWLRCCFVAEIIALAVFFFSWWYVHGSGLLCHRPQLGIFFHHLGPFSFLLDAPPTGAAPTSAPESPNSRNEPGKPDGRIPPESEPTGSRSCRFRGGQQMQMTSAPRSARLSRQDLPVKRHIPSVFSFWLLFAFDVGHLTWWIFKMAPPSSSASDPAAALARRSYGRNFKIPSNPHALLIFLLQVRRRSPHSAHPHRIEWIKSTRWDLCFDSLITASPTGGTWCQNLKFLKNKKIKFSIFIDADAATRIHHCRFLERLTNGSRKCWLMVHLSWFFCAFDSEDFPGAGSDGVRCFGRRPLPRSKNPPSPQPAECEHERN